MITILERCYDVIQSRRHSVTTNSSAVTTTSTKINCPLLSRHLKRYIFEKIYLRVTKLDHNLYDLVWPSVKQLPSDLTFRVALDQDFPLGIVIPDFYAYKVFNELLNPIINDYNNKDVYQELSLHPQSDFVEENNNGKFSIFNSELDLDPHSKWIITGTKLNNNEITHDYF